MNTTDQTAAEKRKETLERNRAAKAQARAEREAEERRDKELPALFCI